MPALIGIDLGTSSLKAVLFDVAGAKIIAAAAQEYPIHYPAPDCAEQNPQDWWTALVQTVRQVMENHKPEEVAAIGFSGQMHGTVMLDTGGNVLHPAVIWADRRGAASANALMDNFGRASYITTTGTAAASGFMCATLYWFAHNQPDLLAHVQRVVLPKDYLRYRLTGEIATDPSDAAGTGLFDIQRGQWAKGLIASAGLPESIFPVVLPSQAIAGELTRAAADALDLQPGIPVVTGCADQPAQALGSGLIGPGRASVTIGSGGQVFSPLRPAKDQHIPTDPRLHVFRHAVPDVWYVLGAILSGGLSLRWVRNLTGLEHTVNAYAVLSEEAAQIRPGAAGLIFLPYLAGERTPHMDANLRGGFIGLRDHHTRGHLARAVMEGVTFGIREAFELCTTLSGTVEQVIISGGAASSPVWRQIQADILGLPLVRSQMTEQAGVGAALLAGIGVGLYTGFEDAAGQASHFDSITLPDSTRSTYYDARYAQFRALYPLLKDTLHELSTDQGPPP